MNNWKTIPSQEIIKKTAENLTNHGFQTSVVSNKSEAMKVLSELLPEKAEIMVGSSTSLDQIGFSEALESGKKGWINKKAEVWSENDEQKRNQLRRTALTSQYYLASANAVTEDGVIVAVDATGSRVGAYPLAAENLILVVGANKITKNLDEAMTRIREYVFPLEDERAQKAYGSGSTFGKWVIMEREVNPGRVKVILVEEELGF